MKRRRRRSRVCLSLAEHVSKAQQKSDTKRGDQRRRPKTYLCSQSQLCVLNGLAFGGTAVAQHWVTALAQRLDTLSDIQVLFGLSFLQSLSVFQTVVTLFCFLVP